MQTTLLGLGIAVILALLAALIGPLFIDWDQYRGTIETEASRLIGVPVRVTGPIDVRLLPSPSVNLNGVELGPAGAAEALTTRRLAIEFGLGTLMRGEIRADQITIDGPELTIAIDRQGKIAAPAANLGFDPDRIAIDRLAIENGRIAFSDAASGARLTIDDLSVKGEVRSLLGPFKVDGTFAHEGEHYGYSLSGSRRGEDGRMKLRLAIDAAERALAFESDGLLGLEASSPSYEGTVSVSRIVGTAQPDGQVAIKDPWKLAGKLKATAADARLDQLDLQYGRDVRTVHLTGSAMMEFGREPRIAAGLTALQMDIDRVLGAPEHKQLPFSAIRSLAEGFATVAVPRLPIAIDFGVDSLTLGGATLTALRSRIENTSTGWSIGGLDFRGPGTTFFHAAGTFAAADKTGFHGPVTVDSTDPAAFLAWIDGGRAASRPALGPMRISGTVTLAADRVAVDGLSADIDRKHLDGHFDYRFASPTEPSRLEAALNAGDLDIDRALAVSEALLASASLERPGDLTLALDVGHAVYGGIEARNAHADLSYGRSGLKVRRLSIADLSGAAIEANGDIALPRAGEDATNGTARTSMGVSVSATRLDGIIALAERFWPPATEPLRKFGARTGPLRLDARFDLAPQADTNAAAASLAKLKLSGKLAGIDVNLGATATGSVADPTAAIVDLDGHLDGDARALAAFTGLDAFVNADPRPAHLTFKAHGTADQPFQVDSKLTGSGGVNASAAGSMALSGKGTLDVSLQAADSRLPHRAPAPPIPLDLRARLSNDGGAVELSGLRARIAGAGVTGRLTLGLGSPLQIDGSLEIDQADAGELAALFTGTPRTTASTAAWQWPAAPFAPGAVPPLAGQVAFRVGTARWPAGLVTRDFAGTARFDPSGVSLADATGMIAGGRLALNAQIRRDPTGVSLQSKATLTDADLPQLFAPALRTPVTGRISLDAELAGRGLSASSLIGALKGAGTVTAKNVEIAGLDPSAIDAVVSAIERDHSLGANSTRLAAIAGTGLDAGRLRVPFASAPLAITDGRALLTGLAAPAQNADVAGSVSLGLDDGKIDARLTIARKAASGGERPPLAVTVSGPLAAARRGVDTGPLANSVTMQLVDQETKRLEAAEKERERREAAEALQREQEAAKAAADGAPAPATVGRAADAPVSDTKPGPPPAAVRRAPPAQPPPPPTQRPLTLPVPLGR